jgi:hypothetical protein
VGTTMSTPRQCSTVHGGLASETLTAFRPSTDPGVGGHVMLGAGIRVRYPPYPRLIVAELLERERRARTPGLRGLVRLRQPGWRA